MRFNIRLIMYRIITLALAFTATAALEQQYARNDQHALVHLQVREMPHKKPWALPFGGHSPENEYGNLYFHARVQRVNFRLN